MAKLTLNDVTTGYQSTTAANTNNTLIEAALENTVSRDGTAPNTMTGSLDMNGQNILNLGNPITIEGWVWEGPWATTTAYVIGDVVENSGTSYICILAHTSGTFSTDLSNVKWQLVATANLPTQTSHSGKYLTTNGSSAAWTTLPTYPTSAIPAGTVMLFWQANAPTGWTKITSQNDKAFRVVSGTGGGTGGSVAFETAFQAHSPSGTTNAIALTVAQMPAHHHTGAVNSPVAGLQGGAQGYVGSTGTVNSAQMGGGGTHSHAFTGNSINLDVSYINIILCSKD
jgi:hypothetical protein